MDYFCIIRLYFLTDTHIEEKVQGYAAEASILYKISCYAPAVTSCFDGWFLLQ